MGMVECCICGYKLRRDIANLDAKWEFFKEKYICRECAKSIAQIVLDEY